MAATLQPEEWARHSAALRHLARSLLRDHSTADDLVQSTLVTALTRPPRVLSRAWFERVLRNGVADHRRDQGRHATKLAGLEGRTGGGDDSPRAPDTAEIVEQLESFQQLSQLVRGLREDYQRVVFMRYFDGLPPRQIAARLCIPIKTVKTRLHRALAELRQRLERKYGPGMHGWGAVLLPLAGSSKAAVAVAGTGAGDVSLAAVLGAGGFMIKRIVLVVLVLGFGVSGFYLLKSAAAPAGTGLPDLARPNATPPGIEASRPEGSAANEVDTATAVLTRTAADVGNAESDRPDDATFGALVVHAVWSDGDPAADLSLMLRLRRVGQPYDPMRRVRTDRAGMARIERLSAGAVTLFSDRGGEQEVEVAAGLSREVRFEVPPGVDVRGVVVDGTGNPVAGADIWLTSGRLDWTGGAVVARAGEDGRFAVRAVPSGQSLGATVGDYAPSPLVDLDDLDTTSPPVEVRLVVREPGGGVEGAVTSANGGPVPDAVVCVGEPPRRNDSRSGFDRWREVWPPLVGATNQRGGYRLAGLAPGVHPVAVRAAGHPIWTGDVEIVAGSTARCDIRLVAGVTIHGTVTDGGGATVAGAVVRAFHVLPDDRLLQIGQITHHGVFGPAFAVANADGVYRLSYAVPGEIHLRANPPRSAQHEALVWAKGRLEGEAGTTLQWDPVLAPGYSITGLALYRDGVPIHSYVMARHAETGAHRMADIDRHGRFTLVNLEPAHYHLRVPYHNAPEGTPPLEQNRVWPGGSDVRLVAPFDAPSKQAPGKVRGRVEDPAGRLAFPGALGVMLATGRSWYDAPKIESGAFVFEKVKAGRYQPIVLSGDDVIATGAWFDLAPGEDKDIGTLVTDPGGSLRLRITTEPGTEALESRFYISQPDVEHSRRIEPGRVDEVVIENLSVGTHSLSGYATGSMKVRAEFVIEAGVETALEVVFRGAVERGFDLVIPADHQFGKIHLLIRAADGTVCSEHTFSRANLPIGVHRHRVQLSPGRYTFVADTDSGLRAQQTFEVHSLTSGQPVLRVELK